MALRGIWMLEVILMGDCRIVVMKLGIDLVESRWIVILLLIIVV